MAKLPNRLEVDGFPISLIFVQGRVFFTERVTGRLWEVLGDESFRLVRQFKIVPVTGHHETGLLGLVADPDFENNNYLYVFYTRGEEIDRAENLVARIKADEESREEVLLSGIPAGRIHNGGILAFGPDGKLYIEVGVDNSVMEKAQDKDYLGGKVLRLNPDGSIPDDNPFGTAIFTYGHRNLFGLSFHPRSGKAYISEAGPDKNDEINILEPGANYGWPEVTGFSENDNFTDPLTTYSPPITPTQNCFWREELYFGSYNDGQVRRLKLKSPEFTEVEREEIVYQGRPFGIIGVFVSPEGEFYLATPNSISRFEPRVY